jgi:membrane protease YdiL (CAAX protease family)
MQRINDVTPKRHADAALTPEGARTPEAELTPAAARIEAALYTALVFFLSLGFYVPLVISGKPVAEQPLAAMLLMWTPALAAAATAAIRRRPVRWGLLGLGRGRATGASRRLRTLRSVGVAVVFPVVVGAIAYGIAWTTGLAEFVPPGGAAGRPGALSVPGAVAGLAVSVARAATLGSILGVIMVAGEEIGWRGFLAPRLAATGVPRPLLLGGVIWAAWHTPLILTGQYATGPIPLVSVLGFGMLAVSLHSLWTHWTERTGSLWPAILGHSAWNTVIQFPFDGHTGGTWARLWVGDSGVLVAAVCAGAVTVVLRRNRSRSVMIFP